jgi:hypothetical protein
MNTKPSDPAIDPAPTTVVPATSDLPVIQCGIGDPDTRRNQYLRSLRMAQTGIYVDGDFGGSELIPVAIKTDSPKFSLPPGPVFYYPGSGTDMGPMWLAINEFSAGTVIYTDYLETRSRLLNMLRECWAWAKVGETQKVSSNDFGSVGWDAFWPRDERSRLFSGPSKSWGLTCMLDVMGRQVRLIFLGTDAHQTYANLLNTRLQPHIVWLQDHGFGCNWTDYAGHSLMWEAAVQHEGLPKYLLCPDGQRKSWPGYRASGGFTYRYQGSGGSSMCTAYEHEGGDEMW